MPAPITYIPNFVADPTGSFIRLRTELDWEKRGETPRHEYYVNDFPRPYTYGKGRGERLYEPKWAHPAITEIRKTVEAKAGCVFEVCFLNMYLDQKDQLGWHADDSPEMDDMRPIAIVSLGVEREIWFRANGSIGIAEPEKVKLGNGSLCLMEPGMQDAWQHRIPKASFECGERISLTFRGYVS